jgi:hypothetical protein
MSFIDCYGIIGLIFQKNYFLKRKLWNQLPRFRCLVWRVPLHTSTYSFHTHVFNESSQAVSEGQVNLIRKLWKHRINFEQSPGSAEKSSHVPKQSKINFLLMNRNHLLWPAIVKINKAKKYKILWQYENIIVLFCILFLW